MKIDLILGGRTVELNNDIDFVLNKQFTDLEDLTSYIVDYSKTIKVPMTTRNNELFNFIFRLDRQVLLGTEYFDYDPSQRIDMKLQFNGALAMEGYAVLNSVNLKEKVYEINIYGQLGKIFAELKEKTIDEYLVQSPLKESITMNRTNVAASFDADTHSTDWTDTWTDYFGFAPQVYGNTDIIDTKRYYKSGTNEYVNFVDDVKTKRGSNAEGLVGDGMDLTQYGEMRSYMTRPYVYVDKMMQLVMKEVNDNPSLYDGYQITLDDSWKGSAYYNKLVFFPGTENITENGQSIDEAFTLTNTTIDVVNKKQNIVPTAPSSAGGYGVSVDSNGKITITGMTDNANCAIQIQDGVVTVTDVYDEIDWSGLNAKDESKLAWAYVNTLAYMNFPLRYISVYGDNDELTYNLILNSYKYDRCGFHLTNGFNSYMNFSNLIRNKFEKAVVANTVDDKITVVKNSSGVITKITRQRKFDFGDTTLNSNSIRFEFKVDILDRNFNIVTPADYSISSSSIDVVERPFRNEDFKSYAEYEDLKMYVDIPHLLSITNQTFRSGSKVSIKDILGYDFIPFKWFIDYCKKFRLYFDLDYTTKTIRVTNNYFSTINTKEVFVDYENEVIIEPVVEKYSDVKYGYASNESKKGINYCKKYKVEYGDCDIKTGMKITDDELTLIPDEDESVFIPKDCSAIPYSNMMSNNDLAYSNILGTSKVINTLDKDNKINYFPFYCFRVANVESAVYLTDDTTSMHFTGDYTLVQHNAEDKVTSIPQFDNWIRIQSRIDLGIQYIIKNDLYWSTFNEPAEIYNGRVSSGRTLNETEHTIYKDRWEKWLTELFNVNNKKVTAYIRMSYPEFLDFKFNTLFVIDNCLFLVNKIIDFNPNSDAATKVELVQVSETQNLK